VAPTNRERAVAAAIHLLGTEGVRSLTHGRVDECAGLPKGSTSNYFRTRAALIEGVLDAIMAGELPTVDAVAAPANTGEFVDALVRVFDLLTGPQKVLTSARLALFVEAAHDDALRAALARGRATMVQRVRTAFIALGARDPELATQALATSMQGMLLHVLGQHIDVDAPRLIDLVVRAALELPPPADRSRPA
jgi:DNA-binding transcriptional regulator YbjK